VPGRTIELHPDVLLEAVAARVWYEARNPSAALAFLDEIDRAIERIAAHPDRWPAYSPGLRRYQLRRFPFGVVYLSESRRILILAVAHSSRRPGYWQQRVEE
jgi:plasmid stabilization system protein ParE